MLAYSGNRNYYRISTQFAITKWFWKQNFCVWNMLDNLTYFLKRPSLTSVGQYTKICSCFTLSLINCHSMWNKLFFVQKRCNTLLTWIRLLSTPHFSLKSGSVILYLSDKMQGCEAVTTPSQRVALDNRSINKSNWVLIFLSI